MTDFQEKLLDLLIEIDGICKQNGLSYYLCEETALFAYRSGEFGPNACEATVAMTTDDCRAFIDCVKKQNRADRFLESMLTNNNYRNFNLRYGNPNTLCYSFNKNRCIANPGLAVTIKIIKYKPRNKRTWCRFWQIFWKAATLQSTAALHPIKRIVAFGCRTASYLLGRKRLAIWLFHTWCQTFSASNHSTKSSLVIASNSFNPDIIIGYAALRLEGLEFSCFEAPELYLQKRYGKQFETITPKYLKPSAELLVSAIVPYADFIARADKEIDFNKYLHQQNQYSVLQRRIGKYNKIISGYYAIVDRTVQRFSLYEKYMPMKAELIALAKDEKYDELNERLHDFRVALWSFYSKHLGLCFDKEIFDITMTLLKRENQTEYAKKLTLLVPPEHWAPMTITNYKGDSIR